MSHHLKKLAAYVFARQPACAEANSLRLTFDQASEPFADVRPEYLHLYEQQQSETRSALIEHRQRCPQCSQKAGRFQGRDFDVAPSEEHANHSERSAA